MDSPARRVANSIRAAAVARTIQDQGEAILLLASHLRRVCEAVFGPSPEHGAFVRRAAQELVDAARDGDGVDRIELLVQLLFVHIRRSTQGRYYFQEQAEEVPSPAAPSADEQQEEDAQLARDLNAQWRREDEEAAAAAGGGWSSDDEGDDEEEAAPPQWWWPQQVADAMRHGTRKRRRGRDEVPDHHRKRLKTLRSLR